MKKVIFNYSLCFLLLGFLFSTRGAAQILSNEDLKTQMINDWQRAKAFTIEYMNTMPANKYSYKFRQADSLRSFAQQLLHLATANVFFMATATDQAPLPWAGFGLEKSGTAQNKDSVMYYVNASYDFAINAVKSCDPGKWKEKKTVFGLEATKYGFMQKAFEHQTHHRGQATIYIRLNDIAPPQEKLF